MKQCTPCTKGGESVTHESCIPIDLINQVCGSIVSLCTTATTDFLGWWFRMHAKLMKTIGITPVYCALPLQRVYKLYISKVNPGQVYFRPQNDRGGNLEEGREALWLMLLTGV